MRIEILLALLLAGIAASAPAQRFAILHRMLPADMDPTAAIALGDVDGDGSLDIYVGNGVPAGYQDRLYLNDGTGQLADATATHLPLQTDTTRSVALGDVDGDGDLDAFIGNAGQNRLCLNDGSGSFVNASDSDVTLVIDDTRALTLGDVDGDGDLDALGSEPAGRPGSGPRTSARRAAGRPLLQTQILIRMPRAGLGTL